MSNFRIVFGNAWSPFLWLLLIPITGLALIFYFRLHKNHRRTRARIISLVLHMLVAVLALGVLTGTAFAYEIPYQENELLILVDVSFSASNNLSRGDMSDEQFFNSTQFRNSIDGRKEDFVRSVLQANSDDVFSVGIITFAREPYLAASLSPDSDQVFQQFLNATRNPPAHMDNTATNIGAALNFARDNFENPNAGRKAIVITDGMETDGSAMAAVIALISEGILVDIVHFDGDDIGDEVQIDGIVFPDRNIIPGERVDIGVMLQSTFAGRAEIVLFNNDVANAAVSVNLIEGPQMVMLEHTFTSAGAHQIFVTIEAGEDNVRQNNQYWAYLFLDVFDRILILDQNNESRHLLAMLNAEGNDFTFPVETMDIANAPDNLRALSQFDQIILMNIANEDMPLGFDQLLYDYVHELGGGLLTIGGNQPGIYDEHGPVANTFRRDDMNPDGEPSLYQQMLPVNAVDFVPPLALVLVIDRSGSMNEIDPGAQGQTRMEIARQAARVAVEALNPWDYVSIVSFSNSPRMDMPLVSATRQQELFRAINGIMAAGGTEYRPALEMAALALGTARDVHTRHVMFITDGEPTDSGGLPASYPILGRLYDADVSLSVIAILNPDMPVGSRTAHRMVEMVGDRGVAHIVDNIADLPDAVRADLRIDAITVTQHRSFTPRIHDNTWVVAGIDPDTIPMLEGFYGVRPKIATEENRLQIPLIGPFGVPIYAQWRFGRGRVGSLMVDLLGDSERSWSYDFMNDGVGQQIIHNIIMGILPSEDITVRDIRPRFERDNYSVHMTIDTELLPGDVVTATITDVTITDGAVVGGEIALGRPRAESFTVETDKSWGFPRATFVFPDTGVFRVVIEKTRANGDVIDFTTYIVFSYSREFDMFVCPTVVEEFLTGLAAMSGGLVIDPTYYNAAEQALRDVQWTREADFNPRTIFLIVILVLFLLDIAVRKFKFKWPWEIVRDRKLKKALNQSR